MTITRQYEIKTMKISLNLMLIALFSLLSTNLLAATYLSTSPANNMPNENGQFIFISSGQESFNKSVYLNVSPIGSLPSKDGQFIVSPSNPCVENCIKQNYVSTSPANNIPNMNGQFIFVYQTDTQ